jgi:uncharacterized protein (DUF302 family)
MRTVHLAALLALAAPLLAFPALAQSVVTEREGWRVDTTDKDYATLLSDLKEAVKAEGMGLVTEAGPTEVAASRGETIPGNRVVGVFRNDFAVTIIRAVPAAMIEAPIRFMVMEEPDGTATLAYERPSSVFAPYMDEGGETLSTAASELDTLFAAIADRASE